MNVAIILPTIWIGGAEKLHVHIINRLIEIGYKIELLVLFNSDHKVNLLPLINQDCSITFLNLKKYKQAPFRLYKIFKEKEFNWIVAPMWPVTSIAIFAWLITGKKGKLFISEHTNISVSAAKEIKTPMLLIKISMLALYRFASGIIAVSEGVKDDICSLSSLKNEKVKVIYNPAALNFLPPSAEKIEKYKRELWGPNYKYRVLGVGSLKEQKNFSLLIRAFAKLPSNILNQAELIILGDGPLKSNLKAEIDVLKLNEQITLQGRVLDPYPWFHSATLFVLSSNWEGFGNVLVEALECGLPIVSTDCHSGPAENLQNGTFGKLVTVNDVDSLSEGMRDALLAQHDKSLLVSRSADFTVEKITKEYIEYFDSSS